MLKPFHFFPSSVLIPLGLSRLIAYFTPNQTEISRREAYKCAAVVIFLKIGNFIVTNNLSVFQTIIGTKILVSLKSLLFRKALKFSPSSLSRTNMGKFTTIITKDIVTIEKNVWLLKEFICFIIQFSTISFLLYQKLGNAALIGFTVMFSVVPVQGMIFPYTRFVVVPINIRK